MRIHVLIVPVFMAAAAQFGLAAQYTVTGGSVAITLQEAKANGISEFDAYFDAATTRAQTLANAAPGNAPFTEDASGVSLTDPIRPFGVTPLNDAGGTTPGAPGASRTRQSTTLEFDSADVLGSWANSNDSFGFTGNTSLGEQIALTNMTRWTGPFTGSLVYGDFALRYTGSKLHLTSNIDFLHAEFAEIGNPVINVTPTTLTISGDLLIDQGLALLDATAIPGTDFGDFSLTASIAQVSIPEPTALGLIVAGGVAMLRRRRI